MDEIIGHRSIEHAVKQQYVFIVTKMGTKRRKETTKGWELLIRWRVGGTDWVALKDIKESYPVQVAEYAVSSRISEEPAFTWCVSSVLKKQQYVFIVTKMGTKRRKETTKGWELLIRWRVGGTDWVALKDIKESYPVQVAEYAVSSRISEEPVFTWCVSSVLKKHNRIIAKTKSKYWLKTHKFRIEIPKSVLQAQQIDAKNGNTLWWNAICKEMKM